MTTSAERSRAGLTTFLVLTFGLSAIFYSLIIAAGSLGAHGGLYVFALMWSPGVSALITRLVFQHNVRGEGWRWGGRWMALAYVDRKSTRLNSSHMSISYAVFCLKKK